MMSLKRGVSLVRENRELRRAISELDERRHFFRTVVENHPDIIARVDRSGRYLYVNESITELYGKGPHDYLSRSVDEGYALDPMKRSLAERVEIVFRSGMPESLEYEHVTSEGTREYLTRIVPESGDDGDVVSVLLVSHDITGWKRIETELHDCRELLDAVLELERDPVLMVERSGGRILVANEAAVEVYGYSFEELKTMTGADLSMEPGDTLRVIRDEHHVGDMRRRHRKKDGTEFSVLIRMRPFHWRGMKVLLAVIHPDDV